ncbi:unnamed protein product [Hymenolepis diminuta]|uniref:Lysosomal protein NCU-G1 n=1 Tax=Hymenolepis diminuta TaxID=6216 RepID=A0A564YYH4_HYMDI|nr:unnamed protein product [Hymenolepis diminuta]
MCVEITKTLLITIVVISLYVPHVFQQTLKAELNPGCDNCPEDLNVLTVSYQEPHFSTHFVINSYSDRSVPSVFISSSRANSSLQFNWPAILNDSSTQPAVFLANSSFYGILFTYLYKYNDTLDVADLSKYTDGVSKISTNQCFWYLSDWDPKPNALGLLSVGLKCNDTRSVAVFGTHGHVELRFTFSDKDQYSLDAPHVILVGGLAVRIKVTIQRLSIAKRAGIPYAKTRWALGLALISNTTLLPNAQFANSTSVSINDEPAPGTFKDVTIFLSNNSYMTWKSVCYVNESSAELKTSRAVTVSSQSLIDKNTKKLIVTRSFVPFIFGLDLPAIRAVNISFGDSGDGFYKASKYIHWSVDLGLGAPPVVGLSGLVWMMIFMAGSVLVISFGLLILFVVLRFCRRWSTSSDNYEHALLTDPEHDAEDADV